MTREIVRSKRSRIVPILEGSKLFDCSAKAESGSSKLWKTGSESFLYCQLSIRASLVKRTLKGGERVPKRLRGRFDVTPSTVCISTVKSVASSFVSFFSFSFALSSFSSSSGFAAGGGAFSSVTARDIETAESRVRAQLCSPVSGGEVD